MLSMFASVKQAITCLVADCFGSLKMQEKQGLYQKLSVRSLAKSRNEFQVLDGGWR